MTADFRITEDDGQTTLHALTTMARAAFGGPFLAFNSSRIAQRVIQYLGESGLTMEGDLPHDE